LKTEDLQIWLFECLVTENQHLNAYRKNEKHEGCSDPCDDCCDSEDDDGFLFILWIENASISDLDMEGNRNYVVSDIINPKLRYVKPLE